VAVHYSIREFSDSLRIDVSRNIALWERVVCAGFAAALLWYLPNGFLPATVRAVLSASVAVAVFALFRSLSARLLVTKLELLAEGLKRGSKGGSRGKRTVLTAKIYRLEYQEHESGGQGIYAVTAFGEPQVLPYVDGPQADEIMAAIKMKFPGLAEMWKRSEDAAARGRG
jgi:hypothetical protein